MRFNVNFTCSLYFYLPSKEKKHGTNVEDFFEEEFLREEPRTIPTVGLHAYEVEVSVSTR